VGVDYVSTHPEETRSTEIIGMRNLISLAKMLKPERIIYSSTSSVYDAIFSPTSYNTSKLFSEQLLRDSGSDYTILRYFNTYGKYQKDKMVVARFIRCALEKKPLLVFGDGSQTRDFTCIDDVIKATLLLAKSKKAEGKTVDIGTGKQTTILQLASLIRDIFNPSSKLLFVPFIEQRKPFEVNKRKSEISGLYDLTGFKCRTSLKQGLMKMKEKILLSE
jgi:UDP-glucose 4-epimerase